MLARTIHKLLSIVLSALLLSACGSENQPTIQSTAKADTPTNTVSKQPTKVAAKPATQATPQVVISEVIFADAKLANCVLTQAKNKNWQYSNEVSQLDCSDKAIANLGGIQQFTELKQLDVSDNKITVLSPLTELTQLNQLDLAANGIIDIKPLAQLTQLTQLKLGNGNQLSSRRNHIRDITPLANLSNLIELDLSQNQIGDVSPLQNLTNLSQIHLSNNEIRSIDVLFNHANAAVIDLRDNDNIDCANLNELESQLIQGKLQRPNDCNFTLDIRIVDIQISDPNLSSCLLDTASSEGWITIDQVTQLSCEHQSIKALAGIQNLKSLEQLNLSGNDVIDISPLQMLSNANQINLTGNNQIACTKLDAIQAIFGNNVITNPQQCAKISLISDLDFIDPALEQCVQYTAELYQWQIIDEMTSLECPDQDNLNSNIKDISGIEQLHQLNSIDISQQFSSQLDCALINQWHFQLQNKLNLALDLPKHCY